MQDYMNIIEAVRNEDGEFTKRIRIIEFGKHEDSGARYVENIFEISAKEVIPHINAEDRFTAENTRVDETLYAEALPFALHLFICDVRDAKREAEIAELAAEIKKAKDELEDMINWINDAERQLCKMKSGS